MRAFTRLLRASASTTRLLSAELLEEHGLTINDYEALLVLSHADGQRLKRVDISRQLLLTPSGITRLLEGLEAEGLVERESCPSDLRITYAHLTETGSQRLKAASCAHVASITALFESTSTRARSPHSPTRSTSSPASQAPTAPATPAETPLHRGERRNRGKRSVLDPQRVPRPSSRLHNGVGVFTWEMHGEELSSSVQRRGRFVEDLVIGLEDVGNSRGDVEHHFDVGVGSLLCEAESVVEENLMRSGLDDQGRQAGHVGEDGAYEGKSGVLSRYVVGDSGLEELPAEQRVDLALRFDGRPGQGQIDIR